MTTTKEEPKATHTDEKEKPSPYTVDHPEFPKLLYNAKNRTVVEAKDKDGEDKLKGKGYTEDPYPPLPPDQLTEKDKKDLESLVHRQLTDIAKDMVAEKAGPVPPPVPGAMSYPGATGAPESPATANAGGKGEKPPAK